MDIRLGDCREALGELADGTVDAIVTDPPYELGFMGKKWDGSGVAYDGKVWGECLRVIKPGGHLVAFGGTRTWHRLAVAIEDAGWEIRDCLMWLYGSGFPKSLDVSKAIDKAAGAERKVESTYARTGRSGGILGTPTNIIREITAPATNAARQWEGWGTALKPAWEPIVLARKPLVGTVARNVLEHGTGGLNIDGCRVGMSDADRAAARVPKAEWTQSGTTGATAQRSGGTFEPAPAGRWPANVILDPEAGALLDEMSGPLHTQDPRTRRGRSQIQGVTGFAAGNAPCFNDPPGTGASRFFYCAKASRADRNRGLPPYVRNSHPTVKPHDLMRYLCRLITPPSGVILDPFMGSGSTGVAAVAEGFDFIGIDQEPRYVALARRRIGTG